VGDELRRQYAHNPRLDANSGDLKAGDYGKLPTFDVKEKEANLVTSRVAGVDNDVHAPVLDIDFEAQLVPSRTEGHYHLYLERPMHWETYSRLLHALAEAGIIQHGFLQASLQRHATCVRKPGAK
jgi:hypothetical protein